MLTHAVVQRFFDAIVATARREGLLSDAHFTVDGPLIEAWASLKSVKPKEAPAPSDDPGNPAVDFHGDRCNNATHQSTTDPEARLARKGAGKEAKLCFSGHVLMGNREGLCVDLQIASATGAAERDTALRMLAARRGVGFVPRPWERTRAIIAETLYTGCGSGGFVPTSPVSVADAPGPGSRITRHEGYRLSQRLRKNVEEIFVG